MPLVKIKISIFSAIPIQWKKLVRIQKSLCLKGIEDCPIMCVAICLRNREINLFRKIGPKKRKQEILQFHFPGCSMFLNIFFQKIWNKYQGASNCTQYYIIRWYFMEASKFLKILLKIVKENGFDGFIKLYKFNHKTFKSIYSSAILRWQTSPMNDIETPEGLKSGVFGKN